MVLVLVAGVAAIALSSRTDAQVFWRVLGLGAIAYVLVARFGWGLL